VALGLLFSPPDDGPQVALLALAQVDLSFPWLSSSPGHVSFRSCPPVSLSLMASLASPLNVVLKVVEVELRVAVIQSPLDPQLLQLWKCHMP
jgi:hypothetical protein